MGCEAFLTADLDKPIEISLVCYECRRPVGVPNVDHPNCIRFGRLRVDIERPEGWVDR